MASFFDSSINSSELFHCLSEDESKHVCRVLRLKINDRIDVLDGRGKLFKSVITNSNPKKCQIEILEIIQYDPQPFELHIAIAPTKNMDRIEWFVEKATEIGLTELSFMDCKNSERSKINMDRIQRILISAMKQSKRTYIPKLNPIISFQDLIRKHTTGALAYCGDIEKHTLSSCIQATSFPILIGPEGDFDPTEVNDAINLGYQAISLGEYRLRTETAGLVACFEAISSLRKI